MLTDALDTATNRANGLLAAAAHKVESLASGAHATWRSLRATGHEPSGDG